MMRATALLAFLVAFLVAFLPTPAHGQAVPLPGVKLLSEGCAPCRDGDRVRIVLHAWRPGVSIADVEVRAAVRSPSGEAVGLPVSGATVTLPAGASSITLVDVPASTVPVGVYLVEGAILDPETGVTLSRDVLAVVRE